jgi:ribosome-binding factor A
MVKSFRKERINELVKEVLSELLASDDIRDPRIGLVTITSVKVSKDMTSAKVRFSVMGDEEQRIDTFKGLISARVYMRTVVARHLKVRYAPELKFVYDDSLDKSLRIEKALRDAGVYDEAPEDDSVETTEDE